MEPSACHAISSRPALVEMMAEVSGVQSRPTFDTGVGLAWGNLVMEQPRREARAPQ